MHQIDDAIVTAGKIVLSDLPFAEGQRVRILVSAIAPEPNEKVTIEEVRRVLRGGVERFDDPFASMIPDEQWEMLK